MVLLMVAGIDTTWSAIGASLWHLATHPEDRRRLVEDPSLLPTAVEEFLRAYAPVTMARLVAKDFDFHGCPMHEGDWLLLPFPAANRDPDAFPDADRVVIDRTENRHAAFGLGIHRCLGSNLARMELTVALDEWLAHYPDFELSDPAGVTWSAGQVRGPRTIPVRVPDPALPDPSRRREALGWVYLLVSVNGALYTLTAFRPAAPEPGAVPLELPRVVDHDRARTLPPRLADPRHRRVRVRRRAAEPARPGRTRGDGRLLDRPGGVGAAQLRGPP